MSLRTLEASLRGAGLPEPLVQAEVVKIQTRYATQQIMNVLRKGPCSMRRLRQYSNAARCGRRIWDDAFARLMSRGNLAQNDANGEWRMVRDIEGTV